ncbi:MAG: hypothetical protein KH208_02115 [Desulfovibrio sp.]|uniref:hypothetical protein n=1 Tax=Desulfovibrio sp. TaxID=885 RepID=UPI0025C5BD0E|nr:hypothetical protein [Desulfovibrio sp.]MBS6828656.1 hypothetical protein [Desulfovibrio sp.]
MKNEPKALLSSIISSDADKSKEFAQRRRAYNNILDIKSVIKMAEMFLSSQLI